MSAKHNIKINQLSCKNGESGKSYPWAHCAYARRQRALTPPAWIEDPISQKWRAVIQYSTLGMADRIAELTGAATHFPVRIDHDPAGIT